MIKAMNHLERVPLRSHGGGLLLDVCRGRRGRVEEGVAAQSVGGVRMRLMVTVAGGGPAQMALPGKPKAT